MMDPHIYDFLKKNYPHIREYFCPLVISNAFGYTNIYTRCIRMDIPVKLYPDTTRTHYIKNVRIFVRDRDSGEEMILGMEFLKNFVIHSVNGGRLLMLNKTVPEDYLTKVDMKRFNWHRHDLSDRYYFPMTVDGVKKNYFMDTGNGMEDIRSRMEDYQGDKQKEKWGSMSGNSVRFMLCVKDTVPVEINGLCLDSEIYYVDLKHNTDYVMNPHALFKDKYDYSFDARNDIVYIKDLKKE